MPSYFFRGIEKETLVDGPVYIARILKEGQEQPYRVVLEHFETTEQAMAQIDRWIRTQTEDDVRAAENRMREELEAKKDSVMNELNNQ